MKIIALLAAAAAATLAIPASAAPIPAQERHQTVTRTTTTVAYDQRHHRHGRKMYWRKVCTNKWRNHHRVRVCRKVRAWR